MINLLKKSSLKIKESWVGSLLIGKTGRSVVQQLVTEGMVGFKVGQFLLTKKLGSAIHLKKNKKTKKKN
jgi:ribosomal protein S19